MFGVNILVTRYDTVRPMSASFTPGSVPVGTQVFVVTGNPNGVQTATRPAIAYTLTGNLWIKTGAGTNNTGWEQEF